MDTDTEKVINRSRRAFLTGNLKADREGSNVLQVEGPIRLGQLVLWTLPIEHQRHQWETHKESIEELIKQYSIIIPEYFPPEYKHLRDAPILGHILGKFYDEANYLFEGIASFAHQKRKDVWVVDPAYNEAFLTAGGIELAAPIGLGLGASALRDRMGTRRQFLATASVGLAVLIGSLMTLNLLENTKGQGSLSGIDFRRVVIAEQLKHLSKSQITGDALLIYPPVHWKVINHYLGNDAELQNRVNIYNRLREIPQFAPLFQARHYVPSQEGWKLEQKVSL